jgi:CRISPR-associated protein Csb2
MAGFTIGWEYLTGCCVATDPASRQRAEWPPHPGRVFMAIAAAYFETGEDPDQGDALRWLEKLDEPEMSIPLLSSVFRRQVVDVYVPVNDEVDPYEWQDKKKKPTIHMKLGSVAFGRARQPRTFPSVWVGNSQCYLQWPDATDDDVQKHKMALERLCGEVTRIGHSSSLVRMWVADRVETSLPTEMWAPDNALADLQARRVSEGTLSLLERHFNRRGREEHGVIAAQIAALKVDKKTTKGKGAQQRKEQIDALISSAASQLTTIDSRDPIRPKLGLWTGYCRKAAESAPSVSHSDFDNDLLILVQTDGPRLPLASTLAVAQALRGAMLRHVHQQRCGCSRWTSQRPPLSEAPECYARIPAWVSGHATDSQPLRDGQQHLAVIPLPFVSSDYADGHLLGAALAFPKTISRPERGHVLGAFLLEPSGQPKPIKLTLGTLGVWTLVKRDWTEARHALDPETWTAHPHGATTWATTTPVVLDRFPKSDPVKERETWQVEVAGIVATACQRIGVPAPIEVAVGTTSWHRGSPRAAAKGRLLRGHPQLPTAIASLGDGFPSYPAKGGSGVRPQFHVRLQFAEPVVGPILLCAGRFLGYGLCKPLRGGANR